jgi:hypothetical protein
MLAKHNYVSCFGQQNTGRRYIKRNKAFRKHYTQGNCEMFEEGGWLVLSIGYMLLVALRT